LKFGPDSTAISYDPEKGRSSRRTLKGDTVLRVEDAAVLGDLLGSQHVVSSNHANGDTSTLASLDGFRDLRTEGILDTDEGNEGELLLEAFATIATLVPV